MKPLHSISLLVLTSVVANCQAPAHPEFEVASVRSAPINVSGQEKVALGVHMDGSHVRIASFSLRDLIVRAYGVKAAQVTGPDWIASERYDVNATLPAGSTADDIPVMLQALLDRSLQAENTSRQERVSRLRVDYRQEPAETD